VGKKRKKTKKDNTAVLRVAERPGIFLLTTPTKTQKGRKKDRVEALGGRAKKSKWSRRMVMGQSKPPIRTTGTKGGEPG